MQKTVDSQIRRWSTWFKNLHWRWYSYLWMAYWGSH